MAKNKNNNQIANQNNAAPEIPADIEAVEGEQKSQDDAEVVSEDAVPEVKPETPADEESEVPKESEQKLNPRQEALKKREDDKKIRLSKAQQAEEDRIKRLDGVTVELEFTKDAQIEGEAEPRYTKGIHKVPVLWGSHTFWVNRGFAKPVNQTEFERYK